MGGLLVAADVITCELIIDSFDDVTLVREFDPVLGVYALARGEPRAFPPDMASPASSQPAPAASYAQARLSSVPAPSVPVPRASPPREPEVVRAKRSMMPSMAPTIVIPEGGAPKPRGPAPFSFSSSNAAASASKPASTGVESAVAIATGESSGGEPSWADAVRLSSELSEAPERTLKPGDVLEHPKFGRCEVLRIDDSGERVSVRIPAGRLVELGLEVLHLEHLRSEGAKQFYKVHAGRR